MGTFTLYHFILGLCNLILAFTGVHSYEFALSPTGDFDLYFCSKVEAVEILGRDYCTSVLYGIVYYDRKELRTCYCLYLEIK